MHPVSSISSSSANVHEKKSLIKKIKDAWARGEQPVDGNLFVGVFFPNHHPKLM